MDTPGSSVPCLDATQRRQLVLELAAAQGFDAAGIAPPILDPRYLSLHNKWLQRGYAGDMWYLERKPEGRYDAGSLLPGCSSVLVVAQSYFQPGGYNHAGGTGKVSRYAWGDDYHQVLGEKLKAIANLLCKSDPGLEWKVCVDTSPLSEKSFALQAGIGWPGRNSLVLNPRLGTYFFIGLLLLSWELVADKPLKQDCGSCTICLQACPTGALSGPGILDSTRCVSYVTTERKEAARPDEALSGWLYGCDTCQEVCPFNFDLEPAGEPRFNPRRPSLELSAETALTLSETEFEASFTGSVIRRRRLERVQAQARNVLAAAGQGNKEPKSVD